MRLCPSCDAANPEDFAFCGQCGAVLDILVCPECDAVNSARQRFCGRCGGQLPAAEDAGQLEAAERSGERSEAAGERKLATVLFADVVGFTSLAERTDPERVARMVDSAFRDISEIVVQHGGTIDKFMGDSVMAVFGVPTSHDDDAERAVAAALAIRALGGDLAFSIGVNSGEVMATAVGREGDFTVIGDTVNVAARLEKAAAPGEVLCGRLTAELARSKVRFHERPTTVMKGKTEPVEVFAAEALRPIDADWRAEGPSLIGRADELSFLVSCWRRVIRDNEPYVLLLSGEAGVGKTRLANELVDVVAADGFVVRAQYPSYGSMGGARLAREVLRQLVGSGAGEGDMAAPTADDPGAKARGGASDPIDPAALEQEQVWEYTRLLEERARQTPLLLVLDDMHRSDGRTLEITAEVTDRLNGVPVMVVLIGRNDPGEWRQRFGSASFVSLPPLSRGHAASLALAFARGRELAPEAARFFAERSNGNPLYLRELVVMAEDRGLFVGAGAGEQVELSTHEVVPATLHALLAARLDALEPDQKSAVQYVAVMGEEATVTALSSLGLRRAEATLGSLVDLGLLRTGGHGVYAAPDPLLTEVAYETLPHRLRGSLHRSAASASDRPHERARHLDRAAEYLEDDAELRAEAAEALAGAGVELIATARHRDAERLLQRAVALGLRTPSTLLALARLHAQAGDGEAAARALELIDDDPADPEIAIERDHTAGSLRIFSDAAWAVPRLEDAAERWRAVGNVEKEAWAHANAGAAYFYLSRMTEAAASLEVALGLFESIGDRPGKLATTSFLALVTPTDRRVPGWLVEALEDAEASGDRGRQLTAQIALTWNAFFASFCGSSEEIVPALDQANRLAELATELGANELRVQGLALQAVMARWAGRLDTASALTAELQHVPTAADRAEPWLAWAVAFSVAVAGGALSATPPFPPVSSRDPVVAVAAMIIEIELVLAGRSAEAIELFQAAHADSSRIGVMSSLAGLVRALAMTIAGRPDDASALVERARSIADSLAAAPAQRMVAALQAELSGDLTALPAGPATAQSLPDLLALRARAASGEGEAARALVAGAAALRMPGVAS